MYYKDKEVYTSSRGGKDYDTPTTYIRKNTFLNQFLWKNRIRQRFYPCFFGICHPITSFYFSVFIFFKH